MQMFLYFSGHSSELSIANHSSRSTVSLLKCVFDTISNWFENHQPQKIFKFRSSILLSVFTVAWFSSTNHNSLLRTVTNQIASFCIDNRLRVKWLFFVFAEVGKVGAKACFRVVLKYFEINTSFMCSNLSCHYIKQIDSMMPWFCSVIDHRRRQMWQEHQWHIRLVCHIFVITTFWRHLQSITEQTHGNMEYIYVICRPGGPYWEKLCQWSWVRTQGRGHSFSKYRPPGRQITYIYSMLPCVCSVIDCRWRQNVVRTKMWHTRRSRVCHWCSCHILTSRSANNDLGRQITCLFFSSVEYFVSSFCVEFSLQPFSNLVYACVWHLGNRKSNQHYTHSRKLRNDFIHYFIRSAFVLQWSLGLLTFLRLH